MAHKITLTGKATSELRKMKNRDVFTFDMKENGSPQAPKGLPSSEFIDYTVFINKKQFNKLKIEQDDFQNHKLLIQGEPTLNVPMDECPGEIGVVCFQIQVLEPKNKKEVEAIPKNAPAGTEAYEDIGKITIPDDFQKTAPRKEKLAEKIAYIDNNGTIDEPISIDKNTYMLKDGYSRFLAAKERDFAKVPVKY
ncbi:plasmid stabilization protein [Cytobacillus sp. IB215665]|uniref:plasmid stabilization protein n=1 Tax=Cytobacillus sp. IB215665 TaxID=3097357 RepID=UPI002A0C9E6C|nr:plasmid stabilization protein [Cytobacillus sp. IB215665]MDX8367161.1 plasmid stabilization protein [Cytobacillus sp. IB215665]